MRRSSSSSSFTPSWMTPPFCTSWGGSRVISRLILSRISSQSERRSPRPFSTSLVASRQAALIGCTASKAFFSCKTSRGDTRPTATLETMRSKSPTRCICSSTSCRKSISRKKYSTTSSRSLMAFSSFSGNTNQRRSIRLPIGDTVRSITSRRLRPSSCMGCTSSRERMVNLSSLTNFSSSIRLIWVI